jgi:serine/threonine-protein kinase
MLNFPEQPKSYSSVFLEETGKPLPQKIDPRMRYALFSTIAKGGKSLIKSCKDLHLSRFVCYKTLKPEFASDEREQQRLIREARVSAMLQHPNTVPTYELGRDARGNPYFTMKLLHGYTLREILDYRERYDLTQLVEEVLQIGHALEYAHTHGVAHRDIKPENILAGPYGEVLLMDWGLAKVCHPDGSSAPDEERNRSKIMDLSLTSQGKVQGTPHYMSPEQINQDTAIDHRTDIYSLGVVLYEILCGGTPSKGEKLHHIIQSTLNDIPVPPAQLTNQRVPKALEEIALRCLQKQPADRYASIAELLHLLQGNWRTDLPRAAKAPATKREEL